MACSRRCIHDYRHCMFMLHGCSCTGCNESHIKVGITYLYDTMDEKSACTSTGAVAPNLLYLRQCLQRWASLCRSRFVALIAFQYLLLLHCTHIHKISRLPIIPMRSIVDLLSTVFSCVFACVQSAAVVCVCLCRKIQLPLIRLYPEVIKRYWICWNPRVSWF